MTARKLGGNKKADSKASDTLYISQQQGESVWRNPSAGVIKKVTAYVPYKILCVMLQLEKMVGKGNLEYGLFLKGEYSEGELHLTEDFYIPTQEVSGAYIDFEEEPPEGFNGVIHRHPMKMRSFSATDDSSINQNFEFSLLYTDRDIVTGIINLEVADGYGRVQLECDIVIDHPDIGLTQEMVDEKISERKYVAPARSLNKSRSNYSGYGSYNNSNNYGYGAGNNGYGYGQYNGSKFNPNNRKENKSLPPRSDRDHELEKDDFSLDDYGDDYDPDVKNVFDYLNSGHQIIDEDGNEIDVEGEENGDDSVDLFPDTEDTKKPTKNAKKNGNSKSSPRSL